MYFRVGKLLFVWLWRIEQLDAWGLTFSESSAKSNAMQLIASTGLTGAEPVSVESLS